MILVIEVGNTNITFGVYEGEKAGNNLPYDVQNAPYLGRVWDEYQAAADV